jgi:hypothetical protein
MRFMNSESAGREDNSRDGAPAGGPCLVVGTPCFGRLVTDIYVSSLLQLQMACARRKIRLQIRLLGGDALIPRVRQDILSYFLADEAATHLIFIDADIGFEPEQVFRLMDFDADITSGIYPIKRIDWEKVAALAQGKQRPLESAALTYLVEFPDAQSIHVRDGFARVRYGGSGFLMIRRRALLGMIERYPELRYRHEHRQNDPLSGSEWRYALFNCMIDEATGTYLREDFSFCRRWTDMGGEIWADLQSRLTHVGAVSFNGDVATQFSLAGAAQGAPDFER